MTRQKNIREVLCVDFWTSANRIFDPAWGDLVNIGNRNWLARILRKELICKGRINVGRSVRNTRKFGDTVATTRRISRGGLMSGMRRRSLRIEFIKEHGRSIRLNKGDYCEN